MKPKIEIKINEKAFIEFNKNLEGELNRLINEVKDEYSWDINKLQVMKRVLYRRAKNELGVELDNVALDSAFPILNEEE